MTLEVPVLNEAHDVVSRLRPQFHVFSGHLESPLRR